jgi:hypothetical protein
MKLVIIAIPVADKPTLKTDVDGRSYRTFDPPSRQAAWEANVVASHVLGREQNKAGTDYFLVDCLMRNTFITPIEEDLPDTPATTLPAGWFIAGAWRVNNKGKSTYTYTNQTPIVIPAVDITDDVFTFTEAIDRYYVRPQYNFTDPQNPVYIGCKLYTRERNYRIFSVDNTDPQNPVNDYVFTDGVLNDNGSYYRTWTEPAKLVTHVGSGKTILVRPEDLELDGTYIYTPVQATLDVPAYVELVAKHPELIDWWSDLPEGGRPTVLSEITQFGRDMESRF